MNVHIYICYCERLKLENDNFPRWMSTHNKHMGERLNTWLYSCTIGPSPVYVEKHKYALVEVGTKNRGQRRGDRVSLQQLRITKFSHALRSCCLSSARRSQQHEIAKTNKLWSWFRWFFFLNQKFKETQKSCIPD